MELTLQVRMALMQSVGSALVHTELFVVGEGLVLCLYKAKSKIPPVAFLATLAVDKLASRAETFGGETGDADDDKSVAAHFSSAAA